MEAYEELDVVRYLLVPHVTGVEGWVATGTLTQADDLMPLLEKPTPFVAYLTTKGAAVTWTRRPWYPKKTTPSFVDALAYLRHDLWHQRIFATSDEARLTPETKSRIKASATELSCMDSSSSNDPILSWAHAEIARNFSTPDVRPTCRRCS